MTRHLELAFQARVSDSMNQKSRMKSSDEVLIRMVMSVVLLLGNFVHTSTIRNSKFRILFRSRAVRFPSNVPSILRVREPGFGDRRCAG